MAKQEKAFQSDSVLFQVFPDDRYVDFSLYQYGWERCKPQHSYGPAVRNHYLFHFILSGKGTLESCDINRQTHYHHLHAGQGFLICPEQNNHYYADPDDPWEYTWIEFDGLRVKESLDIAGLNINQPVFRSVNPGDAEQLGQMILHIVRHETASTLHLIGDGMLFLDHLVNTSATRSRTKSKRVRDFYLREAMNFIEQHYQEDISVEDIASFCGLDRSYFSKIFHGAMGKTPKEFLIHYRITKACQLLKSTQLSIKDISAAVGYPNQLHFSRAFRNVISTSPRDWRKEHSSFQAVKPPDKI